MDPRTGNILVKKQEKFWYIFGVNCAWICGTGSHGHGDGHSPRLRHRDGPWQGLITVTVHGHGGTQSAASGQRQRKLRAGMTGPWTMVAVTV